VEDRRLPALARGSKLANPVICPPPKWHLITRRDHPHDDFNQTARKFGDTG
jgi:hypothetical protein